MSTRKWTDDQLQAISESSDTMLVSAAAGSGKTSVLTERIIRKVTDSTNPVDITRLLVVTYTEAAAAEMKERISAALTKAMALDPKNKRLQKQYLLLPGAHISTIHGFCLDVIRKNFNLLNIGASSKVQSAEQSEIQRKTIMESIIDEYYDKAPEESDIPDFAMYVDNFVTISDDKLSDILLNIYLSTMSLPEGIGFLKTASDSLKHCLDGDLFDTPFGKPIILELKEMFEHYKKVFMQAIEYIGENPEFEKYLVSFKADSDFCDLVLNELKNPDYSSLRSTLSSFSPVTLARIKSELLSDEIVYYKELRKKFSPSVKELLKAYFCYTTEQISEMAKKSAEFVDMTYLLLSAFEKKYSEEKRARGLLDFNDLEHMAYSLLVSKDKEPTVTATETADSFDEIYIDEYQDVNRLQDDIFKAIAAAKSTSRFLVGDVKQSIYAFRGSEPALFSGYRKNPNVKTIFLRHNFRSENTILSFVNAVCGYLFRISSDEINYQDEDDLVSGKEIREAEKVEIAIVSAAKENDSRDSNENDSDKSEDFEKNELEADFVARRAAKLIKQGYRPKDIAVLLRSPKSTAAVYENAFKRYGIPCCNEDAQSLFENPEVLVVMCILNCIDNPCRDIYLAGALKSPIFGVTVDELITIRHYTPDGFLYDALRAYTSDTGFAKGKRFLSTLEKYRKMASEPVDKLIWYIYTDSEIMSLLRANEGVKADLVELKRSNLMLLYDIARKFERDSYRGLFSFINYINDMLEGKAKINTASSFTDSSDAVRILSIHKSKGLEFPVCFLCGASKRFNQEDIKKKIQMDTGIGIALTLPDDTGFASCDTIFRKALQLSSKRKLLAEEKRVLYVALTRPIEKLIIVAETNSDPEKLIENARFRAKLGSEYLINKSLTQIEWILTSLFASDYNGFDLYIDNAETFDKGDKQKSDVDQIEYDEGLINEYEKILNERFTFEYPYRISKDIPAKLAVSDLTPSILDDREETVDLNERPGESIKSKEEYKKPQFLEEARANAAERGTATHVFMQFCDFERLKCSGFDSELERLIDMKFIPKRYADLIERSSIKRFISSELFSEILSAKHIYRETRFNISLPASDFTQNEDSKSALLNESVLVQGVIDCITEANDGTVSVIDYKTDYFSREDISSGKAEEELIRRHSTQLSYYARACEQLLLKKVDRLCIYSFALGKTVEIKR
mgnify:CR=1 FL=1